MEEKATEPAVTEAVPVKRLGLSVLSLVAVASRSTGCISQRQVCLVCGFGQPCTRCKRGESTLPSFVRVCQSILAKVIGDCPDAEDIIDHLMDYFSEYRGRERRPGAAQQPGRTAERLYSMLEVEKVHTFLQPSELQPVECAGSIAGLPSHRMRPNSTWTPTCRRPRRVQHVPFREILGAFSERQTLTV